MKKPCIVIEGNRSFFVISEKEFEVKKGMTLRRALELDEKIDGLVLIDLSRKLVEYLLKTLNGKLPATKC